MSKTRERLNFKWQKSNNQYMILLTIIIGLVSFMDIVPQRFKFHFFLILSLCISFFGLSVISLNADELVYTWKGLRDNRKKVSKFEKITSLIVYLFIALIGFCIIILGIYLSFVLLGFLPNPLI